uniref:Uncharacterized protein n=1 Tax=viral metagenome TaxID=1070528 RepID=A0A6M3JX40_9ZZZZ
MTKKKKTITINLNAPFKITATDDYTGKTISSKRASELRVELYKNDEFHVFLDGLEVLDGCMAYGDTLTIN